VKINTQLQQRRPSLKAPFPKILLSNSCKNMGIGSISKPCVASILCSVDHRYTAHSSFILASIEHVVGSSGDSHLRYFTADVIRKTSCSSHVQPSCRSHHVLSTFHFLSDHDSTAKYNSNLFVHAMEYSSFLVRDVIHLVLQAQPGGLKSEQVETTLLESVGASPDQHRSDSSLLDFGHIENTCTSCLASDTTENARYSSCRVQYN
jgi:hypothetical protein